MMGPFINALAAAFTLRLAYSENHCFAKHNGRSAETGFSNILPAALTLRLAGAPSGDNARRNQERRDRLLKHPPRSTYNAIRRGPQRRQRAPQPLLQSLDTAPAIAERAGPPAATTRAAGPSAVSGDCAGHCGESRAPSGDHARHSPFCSLWTLRRPLRREPGPQRRPRAPQPLLQSLDTAPATAERAGPPAATARAAAPSAVSGHCGESRAPSGDNARHSPFWRQPLLEALDTAPATADVRCDKKGE